MGHQVITIGADGSVSGLQRKPGQGLSLQKLGHAEITRASLIEWDAAKQGWWINVLQEAGKGSVTWDSFMRAFRARNLYAIVEIDNTILPHAVHTQDWWVDGGYDNWNGILLFKSYDDAVKVEIAYLDALRLRGQH